MSNTRYIEIDSQYRDRNKWPLPGAFEIPISQSGTKDRFSALDPVSSAAIMLHQPVSFVNTSGGNFVIQGSVAINAGPSVTQTSDPNQVVVKTYYGSNPVQREDNFYAGSVIEAGGVSSQVANLWIAGGAYGGTSNKAISYSNDYGATWIPANIPVNIPSNVYDIAYNGNRWVAVGDVNIPILYSTDGINWINSANGTAIFGNTSQVNGIAWNGTLWVAVATATFGANTIGYSSDGITWNAATTSTSIFSVVGFGIAWNGSIWVAVGSGTNTIATSTDGINWTGLGNIIFTGAAAGGIGIGWNGTMWVAVGAGAINTIATSIDGTTWTGRGNTIFSSEGYNVAWNGSLWCAVGSGGNNMATSANGITWTGSVNGTAIFSYARSITWSGNKWIAGGYNTTPGDEHNIATSTDGLNWTLSSLSGISVARAVSTNYISTTLLTPVQRRRISGSKFLYTDDTLTYDYILFSLQNPFSDSVVDGVGISISNPSTPKDSEFPSLYIPTGENANNYYVNCIIQRVPNSLDPALVESKTIVGYNGPSKLGYDGLTRLAQLDSPFIDFLPTDSIIIRKQKASESGTLAVIGTSTTTFTLPSSSSSEPSFYVGSFIRFAGSLSPIPNITDAPTTPTTVNGNEVRKIVKYETVQALGTTPETYTYNHIITVNPGFTSIPPIGAIYEILPFTIDNANPFVYTGSTVSQQEMVCYEMKLVNLVLPNRILSVGKGSLITFYPYVYVQLSNVSAAGAGSKNIIYSNNPHSTKVLFRAPITDVPNLTSSTFIKIDGDGMVQTIKFKPNDNLYFAVTLPSGEIFDTILPEFHSPRIPNVLGQISAMFAIRRV